MAGWFWDDKPKSTKPNREGVKYGTAGTIIGGVFGFLIGGPLGAGVGAALLGGGGYVYGEASDQDREEMREAMREADEWSRRDRQDD